MNEAHRKRASVPTVKGGPKPDQSGGGKLDHPAAQPAALQGEGSGRQGGSVFASVLTVCEAIAVAVQLEDVDVMGQPVEQRAGEPFRAKVSVHSLKGRFEVTSVDACSYGPKTRSWG